MEKRSRRRVLELVTRLAFQGLSENEIGRARISMMARNANVPFKGRIQKRKTYHLQIITFGLQRAAGPYSRVRSVELVPFATFPLYPHELTWEQTSSDRRFRADCVAKVLLQW